ATVAVPPLSFTTTLRRCSSGAMSVLVIVQVASPPIPTVMLDPLWFPPTQLHDPPECPARVVSDGAHGSDCRVPVESTGLVPDRSLVPVPSALRVKSSVVAVPPLLFTTTFSRCSFGGMSLLVMVQVALCPMPTVMFEPLCWPDPMHT